MKSLFVLLSEVSAFKTLHPNYNKYEEVYDKYHEHIGYLASIED